MVVQVRGQQARVRRHVRQPVPLVVAPQTDQHHFRGQAPGHDRLDEARDVALPGGQGAVVTQERLVARREHVEHPPALACIMRKGVDEEGAEGGGWGCVQSTLCMNVSACLYKVYRPMTAIAKPFSRPSSCCRPLAQSGKTAAVYGIIAHTQRMNHHVEL